MDLNVYIRIVNFFFIVYMINFVWVKRFCNENLDIINSLIECYVDLRYGL